MNGQDSSHRHGWLVGVIGMVAGLAILFHMPSIKGVAGVAALVVAVHVVGALVFFGSLRNLVARPLDRLCARLKPEGRAAERSGLDFGWARGWMNGLWIAALAAGLMAVVVQMTAPGWWPVSFLFLLVAVNLLAGNALVRSIKRLDHVVLPMVSLLADRQDTVLDAGCGAGRTTVALAKANQHVRIVALDRFDAAYIKDGGRALLVRNLQTVGISGRVRVEKGDITELPFPDGAFDCIVSAHAVDHLGSSKERGLLELRRVLKSGGRFLLIVWVPGWAMFALANVLSFFLTSKESWRRMVRRSGFSIVDEGAHNGAWFMLLE
ncbi:MAG: class I SAM-dependent methyltransferase [Humidesulfovibrio sp.]|uniref:class I SAM-dependent methyltransferase n=1 Tax=Humidesulfovibrio sp. TaxID=2910988 RepID=UPI0027FE1F65|nr:class I SAM-dependent methyltransferase [Humidesulfovibrio sp.]MDQ7836392.1 class I SAM-dependent methyltransferase [Humidesulfovibrio sp.]